MAHPDTHRAQAKSLLKKGLLTEKQHESMMAKIAKMAPVAVPVDVAAGDPSAAPVQGAPAVPAGASAPTAQENATDPQTPPNA